jgi:hypothetical protein
MFGECRATIAAEGAGAWEQWLASRVHLMVAVLISILVPFCATMLCLCGVCGTRLSSI